MRHLANVCLQLWDETGQRRSIAAHSSAITALAWQPLQANPADDERLVASGSDDCSILIWNARMPENKPKAFLTMESPIVALAFTPDGAFIAGATSSRVLIWKVGENAMPRASWSRTPHPAWSSPRAVGEGDEEDEHCLCWDATGQKLAYGVNSRVSAPSVLSLVILANEGSSLPSSTFGSRRQAASSASSQLGAHTRLGPASVC